MLSIIDLITRETFSVSIAAHLASRVSKGASFIVGAVPGGAGKTTVMGALLNLLPADMKIIPAEHTGIIETIRDSQESLCALAHEISSGTYYCYIWGSTLRDFFSLSGKGRTVVTNLHADNLEQARDQICNENGVPEKDFNAINLFIFLRSSGGFLSRTIKAHEVLESDIETGRFIPVIPTESEETDKWEQAFTEMHEQKIQTIEEVRTYITERNLV